MSYDLFSSFDFCFSKNYIFEEISNMKWIIPLFILLSQVFKNQFFFRQVDKQIVLFHTAKNFFLKKKKMFKEVSQFFWFFLMIFSAVVGLNLMGLFPYSHSKTSHIMFVFFLAFLSWGVMVLSKFFFKKLSFFYLFFPSSPGFILPFLKMIEMMSFFIRPFTLMLRLAMNITTGHIFFVILSKSICFLFLKNFWMLVFVVLKMSVFLIFFESCVGIIQGVVFFLLLQSYYAEHSH